MLEKLINKLERAALGFNSKKQFSRLLPSFVVSTTTRCNFNCPHCLRSEIDKNKSLIKDLPLPIFEEVLREAKKINFKRFILTGGEPILHPQFKELISLIAKYDYQFSITTNGWFYKEYWEILEHNFKNLDRIVLSIDGTTAEMHDAVRNKPGSFKRLMEAIEFYQSRKICVVAGFCITKKNYHQIEEFPEFCIKLGIKKMIKWMAVLPTEAASGEDLCLTDEERYLALQKIMNLREKYKNQCQFFVTSSFYGRQDVHSAADFCPVLNRRSFYVDHEGRISFCCDIRSECRNQPSVSDFGFEESFRIALDAANEMKKRFLSEKLDDRQKTDRICNFCNNHAEECLNSAIRRS